MCIRDSPFAATLQSIFSAAAERHDIDEDILFESRRRRGHAESKEVKESEDEDVEDD